jgi:calcium-translocating P-type ATPase
VLRATPGRVRIHLPAWAGRDADGIAAAIGGLRGVEDARADPRTRNALVRFDPAVTDAAAIAAAIPAAVGTSDVQEPGAPSTARLALRGLDRDPALAGRAADVLDGLDGTRLVTVSPLTGHVLVEADGPGALERAAAALAALERPEPQDERRPGHPLAPSAQLGQSVRGLGAAAGLILLGARRLAGAAGAPVAAAAPAQAAAAATLIEGLPPLVRRADALLGRDGREIALGTVAVLGMTASGGTLGLTLAAAAGLRVVTEARQRRGAWRRYTARVEVEPLHPGARLRLEPGERTPLEAVVCSGFGTAGGPDGRPLPCAPGTVLPAGARVHGGELTVELRARPPFAALPRTPARPTAAQRYADAVTGPAAVVAGVLAVAARSLPAGLSALLLLTPRAVQAGTETADRGAAARLARAGLTVVGTREDRPVRCPDVLVVDGVGPLADGWQIGALHASHGSSREEVLACAQAVAGACDAPWGSVLGGEAGRAQDGTFDGTTATAELDGDRWSVGPWRGPRPAALRGHPDATVLAVRRLRDDRPAGGVLLVPRPGSGLDVLRRRAADARCRIEAVGPAGRAAPAAAARLGATWTTGVPAARVAELRAAGRVVAVLGEGDASAAAFDGADLAIGLSSGRSGAFGARADVLAPNLAAVGEVLRTGARRDAAVRDALLLALAGAAGGLGWAAGRRAVPSFAAAGTPALMTGIAATADSWLRLRGGVPHRTVSERLSDPRPERWGALEAGDVLARMESRPAGLQTTEARARTPRPRSAAGNGDQGVLAQIGVQLRSPIVAVLAGSAAVSLATGALVDVALIAAVIAANAGIGAWQEGRATAALTALERLNAVQVRVLRDGGEQTVAGAAVVRGDVLVLRSGDRVPADARVLAVERLEVDEAALTGESLPVAKAVDEGPDGARILLEGSDVVSGTGRAVVVATGADTRMGALAAALEDGGQRPSGLDRRLGAIMRRTTPPIAAAGLLIAGAGIVRGRPLVAQLALGASAAVAAVPEGLPLLAGMAEAGVARRLSRRGALVRRLSAIEALGRVDVACCDKTGTLTTGRLAVTRVCGADGEGGGPRALDEAGRRVLLAAALASPHPDAPDARAHATDAAVHAAARDAGLAGLAAAHRIAQLPFDAERGFHATVADSRLLIKGAAEAVAERCSSVRRRDGRVRPLGARGRAQLLATAEQLAGEGLRVLLVAEGGRLDVEDPQRLVALGFVGISDPVRASAPGAVARLREAGVRVVMLTGDHPATAVAIARDLGLPHDPARVLTGADVDGLDDDGLRERLHGASVVARTTPLQKVRIVEGLQDRGHVVAMTGDGVNDAPALRLADAGIALGRTATEVARQAADVVVTGDDVAALAEALVEGRGFWRHLRHALGMLLGGNAGELLFLATAGIAGATHPLSTRQVLVVNLVTDVLPAVAIAVQEPEHRDLRGLAREGEEGLDAPLRDEVLRRGVATAVPSLGAYALIRRLGGPAGSTAFASVSLTQLAQGLALGRAQGRLGGPVVLATAASAGLCLASLVLPPLRVALGLAPLTPAAVGAVAAATGASVAMASALHAADPA